MQNRVQLQPAYVLHRRPFQNTSLMVDFLTLDHGRLRLIAKGARREKSRHRALLQLFQPVLMSYSGRGEVKTLTGIESGVQAIQLEGKHLYSGLYVNELLLRLLQDHAEHRALYQAYQDTLLALQGGDNMEPVLRKFELSLLAELGYGINLEIDCVSRMPIEASALYRFTPDVGFQQLNAVMEPGEEEYFRGEHLMALRELQLSEPKPDEPKPDELQPGEPPLEQKEYARAARRLLRTALSAHLGGRPLHSRKLFASSA
ncbi:MAG: DNA repair protein RecO [Pseudohongiellaceae bacterium]